MQVDETIDVVTDAAGAPLRFAWRGVTHGVTSMPEPGVGHRPRWRETGRAPRGRGLMLLETRRWRVDAVSLTGGGADGSEPLRGSFDIAFMPERGWVLVAADRERLESQLTA
ncbi:MAG TPA: hypothetical protein VFY91_03565 [Microbacterium sp.]|nr:hypothetical protein [Microbacterium sp.]